MSADRLVTVAKYATTMDAQLARNLLTAAEIDSTIAGNDTSALLNYYGSAMGSVRLDVREADYDQAVEILFGEEAQSATDAPPAGDWQCRKCGEQVEGEFEVCWSCGVSRDGDVDEHFVNIREPDDDPQPVESSVRRPPAVGATFEETATDQPAVWHCSECGKENAFSASICGECGARSPQASNPFHVSAGHLDAVDHNPTEHASVVPNEAMEATIRRAWFAAVLGLVVLPVLLTTYSTFLLIMVAVENAQLSSQANRRFMAAWLVNILAAAVWGTFFWIFF